MGFTSCCRNINRKKYLDGNLLTTDLRRCLGIFDLSLLGISGMMGAGIYVLTGAVAKTTSGPAVPLSYLLAAFAAFLSALCYAEFGARIPTTGSSYIFTYMTMGELWGFLMGWNMILEHGVGSASVAKAWSGYLDSVFGYPMKTYLQEHVPMGDGIIVAEYPDFLATGIILSLCVLVACGIRLSNKFNITFALINISVVIFIIITGLMLADIKNWTNVKGGFAPFGFAGIVAGASRCFYAFAGFDIVASSCEEARNPRRDIPIALAVSLGVVTVAYFGVSSVLTLMVPWYDVVPKSAFPDAYGKHDGWQWAQIVVTIGALCTMTSAMFSGLFVLPRILYAISKDGLLCPILSSVNEKTQVPVYSVIFAALLSGTMALLFDLETLVQFMSIGTLTAYSFVAACVIILRYTPPNQVQVIQNGRVPDQSQTPKQSKIEVSNEHESKVETISKTTSDVPHNEEKACEKSTAKLATPHSETTRLVLHRKFDIERKEEGENGVSPQPNSMPKKVLCEEISHSLSDKITTGTLKSRFQGSFLDRYLGHCNPGEVVFIALISLISFSLAAMLLLTHSWQNFIQGSWWTILLFIVFTSLIITFLLLMCAYQQNENTDDTKAFRVPFVPFLPYFCICTNLFFMIKLQWLTWVRLFIWVVVGLAIYFAYGYHYSQQNPDREHPHWSDLLRRKVEFTYIKIRSRKRDDLENLVEEEDSIK